MPRSAGATSLTFRCVFRCGALAPAAPSDSYIERAASCHCGEPGPRNIVAPTLQLHEPSSPQQRRAAAHQFVVRSAWHRRLGIDAHRFVDWLANWGRALWQMLATNPIGPGRSPYQSGSAFAASLLMVALVTVWRFARGDAVQTAGRLLAQNGAASGRSPFRLLKAFDGV